jgi:hypothetical protein
MRLRVVLRAESGNCALDEEYDMNESDDDLADFIEVHGVA